MTKQQVFEMLDDYYTYEYDAQTLFAKYKLTYKKYRKYVLKYKKEYAKEKGMYIK